MELENINWSKDTYQEFLQYLNSLGNENKKIRSEKIIPTKYEILGITMGDLDQISKKICRGNPLEFLKIADDSNYETIIIQGYVISHLKLTPDEFENYCYKYISKADCWSICDMVIHFKQILNFHSQFFITIKNYLKSDNPWFQRTGLVFLLKFYIKTDFYSDSLNLATKINSNHKYVELGQAWLYSVAFQTHPSDIYQVISNSNPHLAKLTISKIKSSSKTSPEEKLKLTKIRKNIK